MVTRRGVLGVLIGAGATAAYLETDLMDGLLSGIDSEVSGWTGPPPTNKSIATYDASGYVPKVELYESGAAEITLKKDHGCYERIGVVHGLKSGAENAYQTWQAPDFAGPKVVDLKSVVKSNGPYPSRKFVISLFAERDNMCISIPSNTNAIRVPASWMPK